jgi:hypothetical protein
MNHTQPITAVVFIADGHGVGLIALQQTDSWKFVAQAVNFQGMDDEL